jgi:hypothetical protein
VVSAKRVVAVAALLQNFRRGKRQKREPRNYTKRKEFIFLHIDSCPKALSTSKKYLHPARSNKTNTLSIEPHIFRFMNKRQLPYLKKKSFQ